MKYYDVFNGDADGICALHQLRLATPRESTLITGVKRDTQLLAKLLEVHDSVLTVLDISLKSNQSALIQLLQQHNTIQYFDHHVAAAIPESSNLVCHLNPDPQVCTSLIVDEYLEGQFRPWAIVGAFGDNLHTSAQRLAKLLDCKPEQLSQLRELGELLNYNGYGSNIEDLHIPPAQLYQAISGYSDPLAFYRDSPLLQALRTGFEEDMRQAETHPPMLQNQGGTVYKFPAEAWSKRVAGVFSNKIAQQERNLAHALLVANDDGTFLVSVRAPKDRPMEADTLCLQFETGGGRSAAAGVNQLPASKVSDFIDLFEKIFTQ
ncbi:DHH family phosphoesterase [Deltaproteobacteria bacterium TL4]